MNVETIRSSLSVTDECIYMNTGYACSSPTPVLERITATLAREATLGPGTAKGLAFAEEIHENTRATVAEFVSVSPSDLQLTHSTREGIDVVFQGLKWQTGDELLICDLEHTSLVMRAEVLAVRRGVKVIRIAIDSHETSSNIVALVESSISKNTRLVALSAIQYGCGLRMPVKEIATAVKGKGVAFFVDGAQSVGQIAVDIDAIGCDSYAFSGQKWLMGPSATGGLFIHPQFRAELEPVFTTNRFEDARRSWQSRISRFSVASHNVGLLAGFAEAVRLQTKFGVKEIESRNLELAALLRNRLAALGIEILSPAHQGSSAGIVTISLNACPVNSLVMKLRERFNIITRAVKHPAGVRFCTAYFNTEEEVKRVVLALEQLQSEGYSDEP